MMWGGAVIEGGVLEWGSREQEVLAEGLEGLIMGGGAVVCEGVLGWDGRKQEGLAKGKGGLV